jgi:DNA polymerase III subunit delta
MQLKPEQLPAHLARGVQRLYTVHGDETLLAQEAADAIRAAARASGCSERKVFTVSGAHFDWSGVLGAAQAMSLFAERQLIEIRLPSGKPGKDGAEALQKYCKALPPEVVTLVQLPKLDYQQTKAAWFTALEAAGILVRVETIERATLPVWLAQRLSQQGQRVCEGEEGRRTLAFFVSRVEGNLLAAQQELQKLALLYPAGELRFEQVESAVLNVARFDEVKLAQALWSGDVARTLRVLAGLQAEGEEPVRLHYMLAEDMRGLLRGRQALDNGQPLPMALRDARAWGAKEKLFERLLPHLKAAPLSALVRAASECDGVLKGLVHPAWPRDAWDALRLLVMKALALQRPDLRGVALRAG